MEGFSRYRTQFWASQVALVVKNPPANAWDMGSIPGLKRSSAGGHGKPLQYFWLENPRGQRSLAGCNPQDHNKWYTTEVTEHTCMQTHFLIFYFTLRPSHRYTFSQYIWGLDSIIILVLPMRKLRKREVTWSY